MDLSGPKEETLFWDVYLDLETIKPSIEKVQAEFHSLQSHLATLEDERSLSLVGAMIIESYLDDMLKSPECSRIKLKLR